MPDATQPTSDNGVSIWLDDLSRSRIESGSLQDLIANKNVVGVTTNPSIFQKALSQVGPYDAQLKEHGQVDVETAVRELTTTDVRNATDIFREIAEATDFVDGRVSIEVDPRLAHDTENTEKQAVELWEKVNRPNAMIKIPATLEGLPAITATLAKGISVNVTLIFSLERYEQVIDAYIEGIAQAAANGHDLKHIGSVASFFVSRVDTAVDKLLSEGEKIYGVKCGDEVIKADAYVMAFGSYSTAMLKGILDIPVYPLKGYSLTIPVKEESGAPVSTILDETYKIAITRFDNRIRVGGMAEIVGFNTELLQPRRETLEMVVGDLFPRGGFVEQATFWTGLRPMTPDGTPIVGRTPFKNLWTNTGHGTLGWTMACGSGQLLSDLISGRTPAIPFDDLSAARYQSGFTPSRPQHLHGAHS